MSDEERLAVTVSAYDLSAQIDPITSHLGVVARLTLRNDGTAPLAQLALQISSSLQWESVSETGASGNAKLALVQHRVDTDADHTGAANEAVIRLPRLLAPGSAVSLTLFYAGTVARSAVRLERTGLPAETAAKIDWDRIDEGGTFLRGFGDVLWYPASAPPVLLGDGAAMAREAGRQKLLQQRATVRLRVSSTYGAASPGAIFFCGQRGSLALANESSAAPDAVGSGIATAEFASKTLGFRPLSLFVIGAAPEKAGDLLEVLSGSKRDMQSLQHSAETVAPLLSEWLGVSPLSKLTVMLQDGESFADGAFVVAPQAALVDTTPMCVALTHAWFRSEQPWLDRGVAEFMALLLLERYSGRAAAVAQLEDESHALALAESNVTGPGSAGGLLTASDDVALRNKAAAVLWMLRSLAGDEALKQALQQVRLSPALDHDPHGFERALEHTSGKPLGWFFDDWVDHDRGLPDLTVMSVTPRAVAGRAGQPDGALVAVEVRNSGGAVADVPVTVRSGELTATDRLRVPGHGSASVRILFQGTPEEVDVNDGTVPEIAETTHRRRIVSQP